MNEINDNNDNENENENGSEEMMKNIWRRKEMKTMIINNNDNNINIITIWK